MPESLTAIVAGHICLDITPDLSSLTRSSFGALFLPGRLIEAGRATLSTGRAVSNTGLALNKLGIPTQLMGKVGDDLFGQAVRQIVASHGPHLADGMVVDGWLPLRWALATWKRPMLWAAFARGKRQCIGSSALAPAYSDVGFARLAF